MAAKCRLPTRFAVFILNISPYLLYRFVYRWLSTYSIFNAIKVNKTRGLGIETRS